MNKKGTQENLLPFFNKKMFNERKMKKIYKILLKVLLSLAGAVLVIFLLWALHYCHKSNPKNRIVYESTNSDIFQETKISAHRSGAGVYPEETMLAFEACLNNYDVDYFEFDLHITKDDVLILLHDATLDRTSNCEEVFGETNVYPETKTFAELQKLNMGVKFVDDNGNAPYKDIHDEEILSKLKIVSLNQVLDFLISKGSFKYIIEIKNDGELGKRAADLLYQSLKERQLFDDVILGCFNKDVPGYVDEKYPEIKRGAYTGEVFEFIFACLRNDKNYNPKYSVLQLPYHNINSSKGMNLGLLKFINYAHKNNIAIQYWTINNPKDMQYLKSVGADCIMTDFPNIVPF